MGVLTPCFLGVILAPCLGVLINYLEILFITMESKSCLNHKII